MNLKKLSLTAKLVALLSIGGAGALLAPAAYAYDEAATTSINVEADRSIVKGYDVVSYFSGKAMKGDKKFTSEYEGATYLFASEANKKAFDANPSHFAPQFGGFCAMGAALGKKLDVDPTQFVVHNDKLYLNINADVFKMFNKDLNGNIGKAEANWPGIKDKAPNTL